MRPCPPHNAHPTAPHRFLILAVLTTCEFVTYKGLTDQLTRHYNLFLIVALIALITALIKVVACQIDDICISVKIQRLKVQANLTVSRTLKHYKGIYTGPKDRVSFMSLPHEDSLRLLEVQISSELKLNCSSVWVSLWFTLHIWIFKFRIIIPLLSLIFKAAYHKSVVTCRVGVCSLTAFHYLQHSTTSNTTQLIVTYNCRRLQLPSPSSPVLPPWLPCRSAWPTAAAMALLLTTHASATNNIP